MDYGKFSDEELMQAVQKGELDAFDVLFNRHKKPLLNFLYKYTNDIEKSEDLFQLVFLKVFEKRDSFKGKSTFKTWLYSIAVNSALDLIRKEKKEQKKVSLNNFNPATNASFDPASKIIDPSTQVISDEFKQLMEQALAELTEELRTPFILARFQDLAYKEIAETLGISIATVRMRIYRANKQLADKLEKYINAEEARYE